MAAAGVRAVAGAALAERLPKPLSQYVHTQGGDDVKAVDEAALTRTNVAQPAVGVADTSLAVMLGELGIALDMCVGHSYGGYAALHAAGVLGFPDLMVLSEARGSAISDAAESNPGAMVAVGASVESLEPLVAGFQDVAIANLNGPAQTVVSGPEGYIEKLRERCAGDGLRAVRLNVAAPFHSPLVAPGCHSWKHSIECPFRRAAHSGVRQYHGRTARGRRRVDQGSACGPPDDAGAIRDCIVNMHRDGAGTFLEAGPGSGLSSLAVRILRGTDAVVVPVDHKDGSFGLLNAAARLYVLGVSEPAERLRRLLRGVRSRFEREQCARSQDTNRRGVAEMGANTELEWIAQPFEAVMKRQQKLMNLFLEGQENRDGLPSPEPSSTAERQVPCSRSAAVDPTGHAAKQGTESQVERTEFGFGDELEEAGVLARLSGILADSTGFPPNVLDADLELEEDLGIGSIKRVELLVEAQRCFPGLADTLDDERTRAFSRPPTLSAMAAYLVPARIP